ncbi:MAG: hypothetical protein U0Q18_31145 [Bryobacteraceae bacterium]
MKRILQTAVLAILLSAVFVYAGDYVSLRYRIPGHREQFGTVQVERYYAVPLKDRKTEYMFDEPSPQTCVNSLFPHFGYTPCWYLSRHRRQEINVGGKVTDY